MKRNNRILKWIQRKAVRFLTITLIVSQLMPMVVTVYAEENTSEEKITDEQWAELPTEISTEIEGTSQEQLTEETKEEMTQEQWTEEITEEETQEQWTEEITEEETQEQWTEEMTEETMVKVDYESLELVLEEKVINTIIDGVLVTAYGRMPVEAMLQVEMVPISLEIKEDIVSISDAINSIKDFEDVELLSSYDISIWYQGVQYDPALYGEEIEIRFTHMGRSALSDLNKVEVFRMSEKNGMEEVELTYASDNEVIIKTHELSHYIVIGKVVYEQETYWEFDYQEYAQEFSAPVKGIYQVDLFGAQGANYDSFYGGLGGKVTVSIELEKGETIEILTGGQNGFQGGVSGTVSNGGGATSLLFRDEMIAIAGGGGGAGIGCNGGNGGEHTQVSEQQLLMEGGLVTAGGGGGYLDGENGYVTYHEHIGNKEEGGGCYTQTSYLYHNHKEQKCEYKITRCQSTDYLGLGWWPQVQGEQDSEHVMCRSCGQQHIGPRVGGDPFDRKQKCGRILKEEWACGKTENSIDAVEFALGCDKDHTFIESVVMSKGGSNFYQTQLCKNVATLVGANAGNGKAAVTLLEIDAATISYYENAVQLLTSVSVEKGTVAPYPVTEVPYKAADGKYTYTFVGWDDMATHEVEIMQPHETVQDIVLQNKSYLAVFNETPRSYTLTLQQDGASVLGNQQVVVQYGNALPEVLVPKRTDYIFAGYYTGENGSGNRIYREDGIGEGVSDFEKDTTLYAYWIAPLEIVQHPSDVTVQTGYQFAVMETEAIVTHMSGYSLTYQWYFCKQNQNGNAVTGAVGTRFTLPTGYSVGNYDVYCEVTATSAYNGQTVMKRTRVAKFVIEKGVLSSEQFALVAEKVMYDGKAHTAEVVVAAQSDVQVYYSTSLMTKENYQTKGSRIPLSYTDAGIYPIYVYVTGTDYQDCTGMVTLTIEKVTPTLYLANRNVAYNKKQQGIGEAQLYGVDKERLNLDMEYVYYTDEACTKLTTQENGALQKGGQPSKVGTYYVQVMVKESKNYTSVCLDRPAMFNIIAAKSNFSVAGYHGIYDGKRHGLQIITDSDDVTEFWFSDKVELNKENYQTYGTKEAYTYKNPGTYKIYYMAVTRVIGWINDYTAGCATVVIEDAAYPNGGENQEGYIPPLHSQDDVEKTPDVGGAKYPQMSNNEKESKTEKEKNVNKKNNVTIQTTTKEVGEKQSKLLMVMDSLDELTPEEVEMLKSYLHELYPMMQNQEVTVTEQKENNVKSTIIKSVAGFVCGMLLGMGIMFMVYPYILLMLRRKSSVRGVCKGKAKNMPLFIESSKGMKKIEKNKNGKFVVSELEKGETYFVKGTIKNGKTMVLMKIQLQVSGIHWELTEIAGLQMRAIERGGILKVEIK